MADDPGMKLDEYVRETLLAIVGGVLAAQKHETCGAYVGRVPSVQEGLEIGLDVHGNTVSLVKFDLATTVDEKRQGGGGVGIKVIGFVATHADGKAESGSSLVSRIAFSVPIAVPRPSGQREDDAEREDRIKRQASPRPRPNSWAV